MLIALAALAASCGGGGEATQERERPALDAAVAERLAASSDAIADSLDAGDVCGAAVQADELRAEALAAVNAGDVPPAFQEQLLGRANELVNAVNCPPPPEPAEEEAEDGADEERPKQEKKSKSDDDAEGDGEGEGEEGNEGRGPPITPPGQGGGGEDG